MPLLAIVAFLSPVVHTSETPAWQSILVAIGSLLALFFAGRVLINPLFKILAKTGVREIMTAAATYDPNFGRYKNTHMISLLNEHRADTKVMIDQLMRGEEIDWQPKRGTYLGQSGD